MNGRAKRRRKTIERRAKLIERHGHRLCMNGCGKPGPHFVPPSMGEPGFYSCTPLNETEG